MTNRLFFGILFTVLLVAHLCHGRVMWTEEGLPLAAAQQILLGKVLYRDVWFDKPPLVPMVYLLWSARLGFVLRFFGASYCAACCVVAFLFAKRVWSRREGRWAAALLAFFLTFDTPAATLPLAADLLTVLPHLAALYLAYTKRPLWSGVCCGLAFLTNVKATLILASCVWFLWPSLLPLAAGFAIPCAIAAMVLVTTGAWPNYLDQVWAWPAAYAASSHVANPVANGILRIANWTGFHAAIVIAAVWGLWKMRDKYPWLFWTALSLVGVAVGARFFPRYFFQLLPVVVLLAARGFVLMNPKLRWAVAALLLIPLIRFGPRYVILALNSQPNWTDTAMDRESHTAADLITAHASPGQTLYVWGFRPDIFAYTRMPAASIYLDSQAMTGVPADRHLYQSTPIALPATAEARRRLAASSPDFIVDGLSLYNPSLSMRNYPELAPWLGHYEEFARTGNAVLYRRKR